MSVHKHDPAEYGNRKAAKARAAADTPGANSVPALRAAVVELQKALGVVPAK